jgi:small-conductance mechanosensitive channel
MIRRACEQQDKARFDRAHLKECGAHGYIFEAVYTVLDADLQLYMDIHQQVNLSIIRTFEREKIEFAYPTQTLFIQSHKLDDTRRAPSVQQVRRLSAT